MVLFYFVVGADAIALVLTPGIVIRVVFAVAILLIMLLLLLLFFVVIAAAAFVRLWTIRFFKTNSSCSFGKAACFCV